MFLLMFFYYLGKLMVKIFDYEGGNFEYVVKILILVVFLYLLIYELLLLKMLL